MQYQSCNLSCNIVPYFRSLTDDLYRMHKREQGSESEVLPRRIFHRICCRGQSIYVKDKAGEALLIGS